MMKKFSLEKVEVVTGEKDKIKCSKCGLTNRIVTAFEYKNISCTNCGSALEETCQSQN